ncbi:hypothetical protein AOLI_G00237180 [Acnodon oligacanthus]
MANEDSVENPAQFRNVSLHPVLDPVHTERSESPEPSCVSMKTDFSRELPLYFRDSYTKMSSFHTERSPEPSCVSMKTDFSRELPLYFRDSDTKMSPIHTERSESPEPSCVSMKTDFSRELPLYFRDSYTKMSEKQDITSNSEIINHLDFIFMNLQHRVISLVKNELKTFKKVLCSHYSVCSKEEKEDEEDQSSFREGALKITLHVLNSMNQPGLAKILQTKLAPACQKKLKIKLKAKYKRLHEGIVMQGHSKLISEIYTELYITAEKELDEFKLSKYGKSDEYILRLQPVIKASRKAELCNGNLTEQSCIALASALGSSISSLRELNLSKNCLRDSGVKQLCYGLLKPHCKLETLKLIDCELTNKSCVYLASVLTLKSSSLKELALSCNKLCDPGVKLLTDALRKPRCKLETLNLYNCKVTDEGCAYLVSALRSNTSCLRELNLGKNELGESGTKKLSAFLEDPSHKLKNLYL